jgi:hypothetical protein
MNAPIRKVTITAPARDVSAELARHGIGSSALVTVVAEVVEENEQDLPLTALVTEGGAFDWLRDEPDLYTDADIRPAN